MNTLTHSMQLALQPNDPELAAIYGRVSGDVATRVAIDETTAFVVQLGAMAATGALRSFALILEAAHVAGLDAQVFKEVVYQTVPYAGMGKALEALDVLNAFLARNGISATYEGHAGATMADRFKKGLALQKEIIGADVIDQMYASSPEDLLHIQQLLSANCFGDHVARGGLDVPTRELLTLAILASLGGCEPQLKGHVSANARVGNGRAVLIGVMTQLLPFIGYPRTLNTIRVIGEVCPPAPTAPA